MLAYAKSKSAMQQTPAAALWCEQCKITNGGLANGEGRILQNRGRKTTEKQDKPLKIARVLHGK